MPEIRDLVASEEERGKRIFRVNSLEERNNARQRIGLAGRPARRLAVHALSG